MLGKQVMFSRDVFPFWLRIANLSTIIYVPPSSPTAVEDRRTSIDITIIRESIRNCTMQVRWVPTNRMLADSLTKDAGDPIDLLRSCMRSSSYQISPESEVLDKQAMEKKLRLSKNANSYAADESTKVDP